MGALPKSKMTADQFLGWVSDRTGRFELESGEIVELAAERARHARTKFAVAKALEAAIGQAGLDCEVFPDGMTVVVDDKTVRLPDAAVQCAPVDDDAITLDQPVILVEVMSPSSAYRDENHKLVEYFLIPSVHHYLLVSPAQRLVIHFQRGQEPGRVETRFLSQGTIELSLPGFALPVADLLGTSTNLGRSTS